MKKYIMLLVVMHFIHCTSNTSEVFDIWKNGTVKERRFFTKNHYITKTMFYDSLGNKEAEMYHNDSTGEVQNILNFDMSGLKIKEVHFYKPDMDTVLIKSGLESGYVKVYSLPNGYQKTFYSNGNIESTGFIRRGRRDSIFHYYDLKGRLERIEHFKADSLMHSEKFYR